MLSGYDSELYSTELGGWNRIEQQTKVGITTDKKSSRTEIVWCNFEPNSQLSLFG